MPRLKCGKMTRIMQTMLTRERLWQRVGGPAAWALPWAMAAACALPWLLPEDWDGHLPRTWIAAGWGVCALILALAFVHRRWRTPAACALLAWITLLGLGRAARWERSLPVGFVELQGRISAPWSVQGERRTGRLRVETPASLRGMELLVNLPREGEAAPAPGTPVALRGELQAVESGPDFIGERLLWRARSDGAPRRLHLRSAQIFEALGPANPSPLLRLQTFVRQRFDALPLQGTARDLWGALTLGVPPVHDEAFSAFAESGTIHTLVVSGLQVTLVMIFVEALWRRLAGRRGSLAAAFLGLAYCAVVGFSAPVWRGLMMGFAWCLGRGSGWKLPPAFTLHGALLLWLLAHPAAGCEPGFLLAWLALVGMLWCAEPLAGVVSPLFGRWALPFARCAAPWLTTLPLLALLHGGAPLWGVVANLFVLPLVAFLTPLCLALTLLPVAPLVHGAGWLLAWMGDRAVPCFALIQPLATGYLAPWILLCLGWLRLAQRHAALRRTRALAVGLLGASLALVALRGVGHAPTSLSLEAVDIGQGDALLLRQPGGGATLVDTGLSPWAARRIVRVLSRRGVREDLHLIITHPHGDHAGGWATLARLWNLASASIPDTALPVQAWSPVASPAMLAGAHPLRRGDAWTRGHSAFSVRWPPKPFNLPDANMISLVLRVRWRDRELWLMGDALGIQERDLLDLGEPERGSFHRLLKVGHHGSRSASDPQWLQAMKPEVAVITAGRRNTFEFPHPETMEGLRAAGCREIHIVGPARGVRLEAVPEGAGSEGLWRVTTGQD